MKRCTKCGERKPKSEFYTSGKYLHSWCKECSCQKSREWAKKNPKRRAEMERKRRQKDPLINREACLKRFGLTFENYNQMFDFQNGVCAICGKPETAKRNNKLKKLAIDHDHNTKHLRGLLCSKCNLLIGLAQENIQILESAIKYIKFGRINGIGFEVRRNRVKTTSKVI